MKCLFDTNILIYYFNGSLPEHAFNYIIKILQKSFVISVISKMEFLGFNSFTHEERNSAKDFLSFAKVIPVENQIVDKVIEIKQNYKIKLPDAIIAATAMSEGLHLVTRNTSDFKGIDVSLN